MLNIISLLWHLSNDCVFLILWFCCDTLYSFSRNKGNLLMIHYSFSIMLDSIRWGLHVCVSHIIYMFYSLLLCLINTRFYNQGYGSLGKWVREIPIFLMLWNYWNNIEIVLLKFWKHFVVAFPIEVLSAKSKMHRTFDLLCIVQLVFSDASTPVTHTPLQIQSTSPPPEASSWYFPDSSTSRSRRECFGFHHLPVLVLHINKIHTSEIRVVTSIHGSFLCIARSQSIVWIDPTLFTNFSVDELLVLPSSRPIWVKIGLNILIQVFPWLPVLLLLAKSLIIELRSHRVSNQFGCQKLPLLQRL